MSVFSTNQNRQFYVANRLINDATVLTNKGDMMVKSIGDIEKEVYFEVLGPDTVLKSDYIQVKNITAAKAIKATAMETPMKKVLVTLNSKVNNGSPIVGQDYILRINLRQFYGMSDQDQYFKDAAVRAIKDMTAVDFYNEMKKALDACFSREVGADAKSNPYLTFSANAKGLVIEEKPQSWHLGTEAQERVYFDVVPTTVYDGTTDLIWGEVTDQIDTTKIGNGKKIADLEYFCLGERGDQYRKIGWPNDIETVGMVDSTKTYDVFEIHYAFTDTGVNSYRSEKDITIAVPTAVKTADDGSGDGDADYSVINGIIEKFNTATGLTVATLK